MRCPSCDNAVLKPGKLEDNLACAMCPACHGALLSLVTYRQWLETFPFEVENAPVTAQVNANDSTHVLSCQRCQREMVKYRFAADSSHGLDLCAWCDDVWFDAGEWEFLKHRKLHGALPAVFTEPWQRQIEKRSPDAVRAHAYQQRFGAAEFRQLEKIRNWLSVQPDRDDMLSYLSAELHTEEPA